MNYLKLETDKPVQAVFQSLIGKKETQYGEKWEVGLYIGDQEYVYSGSEFTYKKFEDFNANDKIIILKEFNKGKYWINVYPDNNDGPITQTKTSVTHEQAEEIFNPDEYPEAQPDPREVKMGRGAAWNAAVQYVLCGQRTWKTPEEFAGLVSATAEKFTHAQRKFINNFPQ